MKNIAQSILKFSAVLSLKVNKYKIVAITGSVGKTSTKKAIALVLKEKYRVLEFEEGLNTEIGLPLAILQKSVPGNKLAWGILVIISPIIALKKRKFDYCVLEMGADRPGDIEYLTDIARPNIAILTNTSEAHLEEFKDVQAVAKEKAKIFEKLEKGDTAIINCDDKNTVKIYSKVLEDIGTDSSDIRVIGFGRNSKEIKIIGQELTERGSINIFKVSGEEIKIFSKALGEHILYVFAAAISSGIAENIEIKKIAPVLESFEPVKGRLSILGGINGSTIIDDSYNANPISVKNALDVLSKLSLSRVSNKFGRKIAALGSMNELGSYEKEAHREIGRYLVGKCDILVTVGDASEKYLVPEALKEGMSKDKIFCFENSLQAGEFLKRMLGKGDIVLAKGSQNKIRMEKLVRQIMAYPEKAQDLLVRQDRQWRRR